MKEKIKDIFKMDVFKDLGDVVIYAYKGAKAGDPAVRLEYGFQTGSTPGIHSSTGCEAELELGILNKKLEFESTEGLSEGLDMPEGDYFGDVDWDAVVGLVNDFFRDWQ